jgi:zinc/manganese transport system substrate-binding protein
VRRSPIFLVLVGLTAIAGGACSSDSSEPSETGAAATSAGTVAPCPIDPVSIVVTVDQWGDIVEALAGECGDVSTIISGSSGDPHDYEPTPADNARFTDADLVVMNGLDYDHWAEDAVATLSSEPPVVNAGEVVGLQEGDNPHIWYGPTYAEQVASAVTTELKTLAPDAATYLDAQATAWQQSMKPYNDEIAAIKQQHDGRSYGATESVFAYMAEALGLQDQTPQGYQNSSANEAEPSPGDISAFDQALQSGQMGVLIFNTQTESAVTEQLREIAQDKGVPVVAVTETMPPGATSFVAWQLGQLQAMAAALGN